ncbi:hypothetical protein CALVIDRAFT_277603 [Calocera viscosa TUFC12733]|uniref:DUF1917-domain-containing protein n=1 Tax=Calocera viscosa (strain TUFC12733) TaxID=1330018 RepID=A0A167R2P9_CALVF|nr:hypothetical protein CALVIDRAFT_277603 [Calocera viscosa TUFC12733]
MEGDRMDVDSETSDEYIYSWTPEHELSIDEFLAKYKPSKTKDDGEKPWIWVERVPAVNQQWYRSIVGAGILILKAATNKVVEIQRDRNIPWHSNGDVNVRGKRDLQTEVRTQALADLEQLCREKGTTCGKWLFFVHRQSIDRVWATIAKSLVEGELAETVACEAKVSTVRQDDTGPHHLICLYLPNIYDKEAATEVLEVLIRKLGVTPVNAKPDIYTHIGLYTKHPSGIRPTIWQAKDLLSEDALKELHEEYASRQRLGPDSATDSCE